MRKKSVLLFVAILAACGSLSAAACGSSSERATPDHIHPAMGRELPPHTHPPDHEHPALPDAAASPAADTATSAQPLYEPAGGCEAFYAEYRENTAKTSSLMPSLELSGWNLEDNSSECLITFQASFAEACQQTDICSYTELECGAFQESANFQIRNMEGSRFTVTPAVEWICGVEFRVSL